MVLANVENIGEFNSACDFLNSNLNPLTIKGLKELFEIPEKVWLDYLDENESNADTNSIFDYLNDEGYTDEEVIRDILTKEKKKYFVEYVDDGDGYFKIFEVRE